VPDPAPLVSVYMPTRNRADLVTRAAASVLAQDRADLELLIVDDASTDATPQVLARLAATDPRVRVLSLPRRGGAPAARNLALRTARGRFVTGIDDDDEMLPNRLDSLLGAFDPSYAFVCSGAWLHSGTWLRPSRTTAAVITLEEQLFGDQVGTQVLTLRERFNEAGGFDETLPAWQDYDLWTRLIERYGSALRIAEPSYVQRVEAGTERVTERGPEGARRFIAKHSARMRPAQLASQQLELLMLERRRLPPIEALQYLAPRTWRRALRYTVTSNFPGLRSLAERYRRWRWPPQPEALPGPVVTRAKDGGGS
jgi:glycosyltransferase involved in cell wall biosynthesis